MLTLKWTTNGWEPLLFAFNFLPKFTNNRLFNLFYISDLSGKQSNFYSFLFPAGIHSKLVYLFQLQEYVIVTNI